MKLVVNVGNNEIDEDITYMDESSQRTNVESSMKPIAESPVRNSRLEITETATKICAASNPMMEVVCFLMETMISMI